MKNQKEHRLKRINSLDKAFGTEYPPVIVMEFSPFFPAAAELAQTGSNSNVTDFPRPVTILFASKVSNLQEHDTSSNNNLNTKGAVSCQASQGKTGHTEEEPVKFFRTHFTAYQRRELEKTFSQSQYISPQKRQSLSIQLGISNEIIQTWFKNRRVKWRKHRQQNGASSTAASTSPGPYFHYFGHVPYPNSKLMMRDARMLFGIAPAHAVYDDQ